MIIGRKKEKAIFIKLSQSKQAGLGTIFGRRRVGKAFLVRERFNESLISEFTGAFEAEPTTASFS